MIRRKRERNLKMNKRLEEVLLSISSKMSVKEIEKISRVQKRGKFRAETGVITEGLPCWHSKTARHLKKGIDSLCCFNANSEN
jgi:hypothetical protein